MSKFYIKEIRATGNGKRDSVVSFSPGLNIIQGLSNTGKTKVWLCIDYAMGSSEEPFDPIATGYTEVVLTLGRQSAEDVIIKRCIGKNSLLVESTDDSIFNGYYSLSPSPEGTQKPKPDLNTLILSLMGIPSGVKVFKNSKFERSRLTWRTILKSFYLDEAHIDQVESSIMPIQYIAQTHYLSCLLYLMTGRDFAEFNKDLADEINKAKHNAVKDFMDARQQDWDKVIKDLETRINGFKDFDINQQVDAMATSLEETEKAIQRITGKTESLYQQLIEVNDKIGECLILEDKYSKLENQYKADIQRLTFIVDGENVLFNQDSPAECPFCHGHLETKEHESCIEAAKAELSKTIGLLNGLKEAEEDVVSERREAELQKTDIENRRRELYEILKQELQPRAEQLKTTIRKNTEYENLKSMLAVYRKMSSDFKSHIDSEHDLQKKQEGFKPRDYFPDNFKPEMSLFAKEILSECKYDRQVNADFDMSEFDIRINGIKKATNHGKGYRSFLNTVVALMLRKYLSKNAKYYPGILVVDTPVLGLDQGIDAKAPESMRNALFQYFCDHQDEGQLIIIENSRDVPPIDYESYDVNMTSFTKTRNEGRYGFLIDYSDTEEL